MAFKTFNAGDVLTAADMNTYLMNQAVISCTSGSRPGSPTDGMVIYETDTNKLLVREGSVWRRVPIDSETGGPWDDTQAANDTTASTSYVAGTNNAAVFVAPPSGKVYVSVTGSVGTNAVAAAVGAWMSFEVRTGGTAGSGTVVLAAADSRAVMHQPTNSTTGFKYAPVGLRFLVQSLTAGSTYHARSMFKTDNATATAAVINRYLLVEPVL